jgi:hypothetical protein
LRQNAASLHLPSTLLALIEQYQLPVTLVLVTGVALYQIRKRRARKASVSSSS